MTYVREQFSFHRLLGARLGWSFRVGQSQLGADGDQHVTIPISAMSIGDGYTVGDAGQLSLDPATATATMAVRGTGTPEVASVPLRIGDAVEATYGGTVQFKGRVTGIACTLAPAGRPGHDWTRRTTYTMQTAESVALHTVVSWAALPAESALVRLRRWFTVDTSRVAAAHLSRCDLIAPAEDAGSGTLLDLARAFTDVTGLPLRLASYWYQDQYTSLMVYDTSNDWPDQPVAPIPGATFYADDAAEVGYETDAAGQLAPTNLALRTNDTALTGYGDVSASLPPALLGTTFTVGMSRLGNVLNIRTGFLSGGVVDVFGRAMPAARVNQTFGVTYTASLELTPPVTLTAP